MKGAGRSPRLHEGWFGPALVGWREGAHLRQVQLAQRTPPRLPGGHRRPELLVQPEPALVEVARLTGRRQLRHGSPCILEPVAELPGQVLLDLGRIAGLTLV